MTKNDPNRIKESANAQHEHHLKHEQTVERKERRINKQTCQK